MAQLALLELHGVDPSNLADFFRISPWDPDDLRLPLLEFVIDYLKKHQGDPTCPIYLTLDDSLTAKDKATRHLQSYWHSRLRQDHQREVLQAACEEAAQGTAVEEILERYLALPKSQVA